MDTVEVNAGLGTCELHRNRGEHVHSWDCLNWRRVPDEITGAPCAADWRSDATGETDAQYVPGLALSLSEAMNKARDLRQPGGIVEFDPTKTIRKFSSGATRDTDEGKYDYEAFFSPLVLERRAEYMHKHRKQPDGTLRDGGNWQKGMGLSVFMKSAWRHFSDWWAMHRGGIKGERMEETVCALMFNAEGYLFELIQERKKNELHQRT